MRSRNLKRMDMFKILMQGFEFIASNELNSARIRHLQQDFRTSYEFLWKSSIHFIH